jgi:uncharacterized membrane protein
MTWLGVVALFVSVAFFINYAIENAWIGPLARVVVGMLAGVAMLAVGDRLVRRRAPALGQGLLGGGLGVLYLTLYAAFAYYRLLPSLPAAGALLGVMVAGMTLAILHDALALAFLAMLGGLLTPVLVSTGDGAPATLMSYLLVLNLGVLGVALFRRWRALDILSLAGTWLLIRLWVEYHYTRALLWPTLAWVSVFFLLFYAIPFLYNFRRREPIPVERFVLALANSAITLALFAHLLAAPSQQPLLGFLAFGMSAVNLAMGALTRRRLPGEVTPLFGFISLAVSLFTLAIPLAVRAFGVPLAWAIEGPVLAYLGFRFRYYPVRAAGLLVLGLATWRLFLSHWPLHAGSFLPIVNPTFLGALSIPVAYGLYAYLIRRWQREARAEDIHAQVTAALVGGFLGVLLLQHEVQAYFRLAATPAMAALASVFLWAAGGMAFVLATRRLTSLVVRCVALLPWAIALLWGLMTYGERLAVPLVLNSRFGVLALVALLAFLSWHYLRRTRDDSGLAQVLFGSAEAFAFLVVSLEAYQWGHTHGAGSWLAQLALSVAWGLFAMTVLIVGILRRSRGMRLTALTLFLITSVKLVLVDLSILGQLYRILSFLIVGLLMIGASYLYHRLERALQEPADESV